MNEYKLTQEERHVLTTARAELAPALKHAEASVSKRNDLLKARAKLQRNFDFSAGTLDATNPKAARRFTALREQLALIEEQLAALAPELDVVQQKLRPVNAHTRRVVQAVLGVSVQQLHSEAAKAFRPFFSHPARAAQVAVECCAVRQAAQFVQNFHAQTGDASDEPACAVELLAVIDTLLAGEFEFPALR